MIKIIHNRNKFFIFSGILMLASILALSIWALKLGIDFTGGSLMEISVEGKADFSAQDISGAIKENLPEIGEVRTQPTQDGFLIRSRDLSEEEHQQMLATLKDNFAKEDIPVLKLESDDEGATSTPVLELEGTDDKVKIVENRFESIGPVIGQELKSKAVWAIGIAIVIIILFIAFAFRKVSKPVASWKYGIGAIIALTHDVLIVTGVFAVLGHFLNYEVDILFVTALLTILGYSVNDTIVVYDRTRENLIYNPQTTFEDTVNKSVNETIARSVNTGLTTLLVLLTLYFLGGATIKNFVLALMIGTVIGTYSSIFVASPLLVVWQQLKRK